MVEYQVKLDSDDLRRRLNRLGADVGDINRIALGRLAEVITGQSEKRYFRPRGPGEMLSRNDQRGPGSLRRISGRLAQSLTHRVKSDYEVEVGTNVWYGAQHEYGLNGYPARPFLAPALEDVFDTGVAQRVVDRTFAQLLERRWER